MPKLKIEDLDKIRDRVRRSRSLEESRYRGRITVHMGTCGLASGAGKVMDALRKEIDGRGIQDLLLTTSGCVGLCSREPMVTVELRGEAPVKYIDLSEDKIPGIFESHVLGGSIVSEYVLAAGSETTH